MRMRIPLAATIGRTIRSVLARSLQALAVAALAACSGGGELPGDGDTVTARTENGVVAGVHDGGLNIYKGIPFAAPPVGDLRWRPPEPAADWTGVRQATESAPACMQAPSPVMNVPTQPFSEDCLYLNVWSPATSPEEGLPVLVWIHGGGYNFGTTAMPLFDGANLARRGVIHVNIAYRLGQFGFLAHPELSAESPQNVSGNYGLLDQIAALQWVQRNIQAFGGDPGRVTIMGQSAGGGSVTMLAQSPLARGLFGGVIAQSGAAFGGPDGDNRTLADAERSGQEVAETVGAASIAELRALPAETILTTTLPPGARGGSGPLRDGYVVPLDPIALYEDHGQNDTPILMGNNDVEGGFFVQSATLDTYREQVRDQFGSLADDVLAAYPASDDAEALRALRDLRGDMSFGWNHWTLARLQSRTGSGAVYYYHFNQDPPARDGVPPGPIHGAELPYVFNTQHIRDIAWTERDRALADEMARYWTNFVKHGDPNGEGLPRWPAFTEDSPQVMYFNNEASTVGGVPHGDQLRVLEAYATRENADAE